MRLSGQRWSVAAAPQDSWLGRGVSGAPGHCSGTRAKTGLNRSADPCRSRFSLFFRSWEGMLLFRKVLFHVFISVQNHAEPWPRANAQNPSLLLSAIRALLSFNSMVTRFWCQCRDQLVKKSFSALSANLYDRQNTVLRLEREWLFHTTQLISRYNAKSHHAKK